LKVDCAIAGLDSHRKSLQVFSTDKMSLKLRASVKRCRQHQKISLYHSGAPNNVGFGAATEKLPRVQNFSVLMIVRQPSQLCALLLLALVALQQGCAPKTPLQPLPAEPSEKIAEGEAVHTEEMPAQPPAKLPELSLEASKKERLPESVVARPEKESASPSIN
jgi:hypothetical protein